MPTRYVYNAHAVGLAGHITLPFEHQIESQAPSAIAPMGGFSAAKVRNFNYKNIISFSSCETRVAGAYSARENAFFTAVESVVEDLNIMGVLRVERVSGRIMAKHAAKPADGAQREDALPEPLYDEPVIVPVGTSLEGLSFAGAVIDVKLDMGRFTNFPTWSALRKNSTDAFRRKRFMTNPDDPTGSISATLVDRLEVNGQELDQDKAMCLGFQLKEDGSVALDQFGTIRLAQFIAGPYSRSFTALQVELGCAVQGSVTAGAGEGHGTPMLPPGT
jgi:hypothetical protein